VKTDTPAIAEIRLVRVHPSGVRTEILVEVGQPFRAADDVWRTRVAFHGLDGRLSDICGEDSLQSLSLALQMVRSRLTSVIANGDRLIDTEGGEFPMEAYFPGKAS
jgi:hypothetical protein